jgi:hypothetical protein
LRCPALQRAAREARFWDCTGEALRELREAIPEASG